MLLPTLISTLLFVRTFAVRDTKSHLANGVPVSKISDKDILYKSEFPYAAILLAEGEHICGSIIIGRRAVLTSAHCVVGRVPSDLQIKAGTYWIHKSAHGLIQHRDVQEIIIHEKYNEETFLSYDIAILKLEREFVISSFVKVIDIATPAERTASYNQYAVVLGWGEDENGQDTEVLHKADMILITEKNCKKKTKGRLTMDKSMICAVGKMKDVTGCVGDSGGPLIRRLFKPVSRDILLGAVSYGIPSRKDKDLCDPSYPLIFTDIVNIRPWIKKHLED